MIQHINRHILTMDHYTDPHQFEPLLPQRRLEEFRARTRGVIEQAVGLSGSAHPVTIATLRELVREMNSYYSNRIEGQSTHPLNIERALHQDAQARLGRDLTLNQRGIAGTPRIIVLAIAFVLVALVAFL